MTDDVTRTAMVGLLARWQMALRQRDQQYAIRDRAAEEGDRFQNVAIQCREACKALGYDREGLTLADWRASVADFLDEALALYNGNRPSDLPEWVLRDAEEEDSSQETVRPPVREIALALLRSAGPEGMKASEIRKHIDENFAGGIHEKTVGMTLYRLLQDNQVRRDGHTWFYVAPTGGTKNPGVGAPGRSS